MNIVQRHEPMCATCLHSSATHSDLPNMVFCLKHELHRRYYGECASYEPVTTDAQLDEIRPQD